MPATQISFSDFAAAQALALQAVTPCPPSIVAVHAAASVVAHGGDDAGECIPFSGVYERPRGLSFFDVRGDSFDGLQGLSVDWACGGMDAPRDYPSGSHVSWLISGCVKADAFVCRVGL